MMKLTLCIKALGRLSLAWGPIFYRARSLGIGYGICLICLGLSTSVLAEYALEPQTGTQLAAQKPELLAAQGQGPFIWLDEQGPKDVTIQMVSLAQDLGLAVNDVAGAGAWDVTTLARLDEQYTQLAIELLDLIAPFISSNTGDTVGLTAALVPQQDQGSELADLVKRILPTHVQVTRLRAKIRQYQKISTYVWPSMPETQLTLGQRSAEVAKLRWMLIQLNDLKENKSGHYRSAIFDRSLTTALIRFQQRHGLEPSGELDSQTRQALNVPPTVRIAQMRRTLLRWFALPASMPGAYVWINLPSYRLDVIENDMSVLSMKVIVGKPASPTPELVTQLTLVTVNPTWTPPSSIIYEELLAQHSKEPGYLASRGFELRKVSAGVTSVIDLSQLSRQRLTQLLPEYQLVQAAGEHNALGKFRFAIPNADAIYLHDTPVMSLFSEHDRALSHGCVRLEDAPGLLDYLSSKTYGLDTAKLKEAITQDSPRYFHLANPLAVFLTYHTSWVDAHGLLQLRADVYHLEQMN